MRKDRELHMKQLARSTLIYHLFRMPMCMKESMGCSYAMNLCLGICNRASLCGGDGLGNIIGVGACVPSCGSREGHEYW